jgi:hypothetical protein
MTHTNHRLGERRSLEHDYVLFTMVEKMFTSEQKKKLRPGFKKAIQICDTYDPVLLSTDVMTPQDRNELVAGKADQVLLPAAVRYRARWIKGWKGGEFYAMVGSREEILAIESPVRYCSVVYDNREAMMKALSDIKDADLGHSVIISGIFDVVFEACKRIGIQPHTVNMSAGIWGRTDLLPKKKILEIMTMCGHAFVSRYLVEHLINRVKKGTMTSTEAAVEMSKQCMCNYFNPVRTVNLIDEYIAGEK